MADRWTYGPTLRFVGGWCCWGSESSLVLFERGFSPPSFGGERNPQTEIWRQDVGEVLVFR